MIRKSAIVLSVLIGYVAHGKAMDFRLLAAVAGGKTIHATSAYWLLHPYTNDNVGMLERYMTSNGITLKSCANAKKLYSLKTRLAYAERVLARCDGTEVCKNRMHVLKWGLFSSREDSPCLRSRSCLWAQHMEAHTIVQDLRRSSYLSSGDVIYLWVQKEEEPWSRDRLTCDARIEIMKIILHDKHLGPMAIAQLRSVMFRDEKDKNSDEYKQLQEQLACYVPGKIPKTDAESRAAYDRQPF